MENVTNYSPLSVFLEIFPERAQVEIRFHVNNVYQLTLDFLSFSPFLTFHSIILPLHFPFTFVFIKMPLPFLNSPLPRHF